MKTHDSVTFGKYLVSLANSRQRPLNMTKLQKLVFIIYGHLLAENDHHIVNEHPQAWPFGPVFPRIHKKVDYTKVTPIDDASFNEIQGDEGLPQLLEAIIDKYTAYTATQLSSWSHMDGSPWDRTTKLSDFKWSREIPDEFIVEYFSKKSI